MDHYGILMIPRDADAQQIRAAFRTLIARQHPDCSNAKDAHCRAAAIIDAYRTLSRPDRRRAYDDRRRLAGTAPVGGERRSRERRSARRPGPARRPWIARALPAAWASAAVVARLATAAPAVAGHDDSAEALHLAIADGARR